MNGMKFNAALIFAIVLQAIALVWYVSKIDSRVNILYNKLEKENEASVVENQVKMKLDLSNLIEEVKKMKKDLKSANKTDKKIMKQHDQIFDLLENNSNTPSNYSYGD